MKTPLEIFDVKNFVREIGEANAKFVKGAELFAGIPRTWSTRKTSSSSTITNPRAR
jgi:hypothetical protein